MACKITLGNKVIGSKAHRSTKFAETLHVFGTATECESGIIQVEIEHEGTTSSGTARVYEGYWSADIRNVSYPCEAFLRVTARCQGEATPCEVKDTIYLDCVGIHCPALAWRESEVGDCNRDGTRNVTTTFQIRPVSFVTGCVAQWVYTVGEPLTKTFVVPPSGGEFTDTHAFPSGTGERYPVTMRILIPSVCQEETHLLAVIEPCP